MSVQGQRAAGPIDHDHIEVSPNNQLVPHLRHPIRERSVDESVDDELGHPFRVVVAADYRLFVVGNEQLALGRILLGVQDETRVDDAARQREQIQRSVDQVIPFARDVQTANFAVATGLVLN